MNRPQNSGDCPYCPFIHRVRSNFAQTFAVFRASLLVVLVMRSQGSTDFEICFQLCHAYEANAPNFVNEYYF